MYAKQTFVAAFLLLLSTASCGQDLNQSNDGQFVIDLSPKPVPYVITIPSRQDVPLDIAVSKGQSGIRTAKITIDTLKLLYMGMAGERAHTEAKEKVKETLAGSASRYAMVPILADKPTKFITSMSEIEMKQYMLGEPRASNSLDTLLAAVLGTGRSEIRQDGARSPRPTYLAGIIIGETRPDGTVEPRPLEQHEIDQFMINRTKALEDEAKARAAKIEEERLEAEKAFEKAAADEKKRAEHERQQKERERLAAEEKEKERKAKESWEAVEKRAKERDEACRHGRTAECALIDHQYTQDVEKLDRFHNTAMCMKDAEHGRCAQPGGCVYCTVTKELAQAAREKAEIDVRLLQKRRDMNHENVIMQRSLDRFLQQQIQTGQAGFKSKFTR